MRFKAGEKTLIMERCVTITFEVNRIRCLSGYLPSDPGIRGRMASITVTDFTLKLIDEAEKQAKVVQTVQFPKVLAFEINSSHRNWRV